MTAEATISAERVGVGEAFTITVNVATDDKIADLPWPAVESGLENFSVEKNSSTASSSQTTIVNGRVSQSTTWVTRFIWTLAPKKAGAFTIGPITFAYKDFSKNLGSARVTAVVVEAGLELISTLSKRRVYIGEQLRYNLRLVPKASVQDITPPDFQDLLGGRVYMQRMQKEIKPKTVTLEGRPTRVFDIGFALFPLLAGRAEIPSYPVEYKEVSRTGRRGRSVFDMFESDFFGGRTVERQTMTEPAAFEVLPLPPGAPAGFSGAVGDYSIDATVDKDRLPSGEAVTLTVTVRGDGQPKAITRPALPDLPQFEVFDPETESREFVRKGRLESEKTFKYVLIPSRKGDFTIGAVRFSFFNVNAGKYETAATPPIPIQVSQGKAVASTQARFLTQKEIREIGSDIRYIKPVPGALREGAGALYRQVWFWSLYPLPVLLFSLLVLHRGRTRRLQADAGLRRRLGAKSVAKKWLGEASGAKRSDDPKAFYRALERAVERFVSDRANTELRGMLREDISRFFAARSVPEDVQKEYFELMEVCGRARFAPVPKDAGTWERDFETAERLLSKLEKIFK